MLALNAGTIETPEEILKSAHIALHPLNFFTALAAHQNAEHSQSLIITCSKFIEAQTVSLIVTCEMLYSCKRNRQQNTRQLQSRADMTIYRCELFPVQQAQLFGGLRVCGGKGREGKC